MGKYTLDEIIEMITLRKVNMSNLREIVDSLSVYPLDDVRIEQIYFKLSMCQELDEKVRDWFRQALSKIHFADQIFEVERQVKPEVVIEENKEIIQEAEQQEEIIYNNIDTDYSDYLVSSIIAFAAAKGLKVIYDKTNKQLSLELNNATKTYTDNVLQKLYNSNSKIDVSLDRINQTAEELLTVSLNEKNLTPEQIEQAFSGVLEEVNNTLKDTDSEMDYEERMNPELKEMKDKFVNDDPNIPNEDFKIGYSNEDSGKSFYIIANSKKQALEMSELMGYEIKEDRGGNVFELDTDSRMMEGTKLEKASENVNDLDEMKDPGLSEIDNSVATGLNDVYVDYNVSHYGDQEDYLRVVRFIEDNRTKDSTAIVRIDSTQTENQRIITCYDEDGLKEQLIISNGDNFDEFILPEIINKFAVGSTFDSDSRKVTENPDDTVNYETVSNFDTYLYINNYDRQTIFEGVDSQLASMQPSNELSNSQNSLGTNGYLKKLGEMPTRNAQSNLDTDAKISFLSLLTIIIAILFGICIFLTIYFIL